MKVAEVKLLLGAIAISVATAKPTSGSAYRSMIRQEASR